MSPAERYALLLTSRSPGWGVVIRQLDSLLREAEQATFTEEDPTRVVLLAQQARGASELLRKFKRLVELAAETPQSETGDGLS